MKRILFFWLALLPLLGFSQSTFNFVTSVGASTIQIPGLSGQGSTVGSAPFTIYTETIGANNLIQGKVFSVDLYCSVSTALSLLPSLTIKVFIGTDSLVLANAVLLSAGVTKAPTHIRLIIAQTSGSSQFVYSEMLSPNTGIQLGTQVNAAEKNFFQDFSTAKVVKLTAQFSTAVNLGGCYFYVDLVNRPPY